MTHITLGPSSWTRGCLLAVLVGLGCGPAWAANQSDENACRPDVFRLCADSIPDETAIVACLDRRVRELTPDCHQVIDPPRSAAVPRRR